MEDGGLVYIFLPDYIEQYGLEDFESSVKAIENVTRFVSCEFAVRPFILKYGGTMMKKMRTWSLHKSYHVRRLSSEGSRPRLPWAISIPELKKDPSPILPILENLKNDPSEWVRRSVANNLNDIAKDHPGLVIELARKWKGISRETDAIIKHGSRTLLKKDMLKYWIITDWMGKISMFQILKLSLHLFRSAKTWNFHFPL
jgi:3-methyladenine DNA glycosylase AlkC